MYVQLQIGVHTTRPKGAPWGEGLFCEFKRLGSPGGLSLRRGSGAEVIRSSHTKNYHKNMAFLLGINLY